MPRQAKAAWAYLYQARARRIWTTKKAECRQYEWLLASLSVAVVAPESI